MERVDEGRSENRNTTPLLPSKDSRLGEVGGARGDSVLGVGTWRRVGQNDWAS